jgi:hypothetical protein
MVADVSFKHNQPEFAFCPASRDEFSDGLAASVRHSATVSRQRASDT